jgi:peptide/nickel transport system substrate-binding protein
MLFSIRQFDQGQLPAPLPYDPEVARQLLEEAGWVDEDGDGLREKGGVQAHFSLDSRGAGKREILIQHYLRQIGLAVEIESSEGARARMDAGEFDAGVHIVQPGPESFAKYFGANSIVGYRNPRVAKVLAQAIETSDQKTLDELYVSIWDELTRDVPLVMLHPFTRTHAVHRRIRGLNPIMLKDPLEQMKDLWIEAE